MLILLFNFLLYFIYLVLAVPFFCSALRLIWMCMYVYMYIRAWNCLNAIRKRRYVQAVTHTCMYIQINSYKCTYIYLCKYVLGARLMTLPMFLLLLLPQWNQSACNTASQSNYFWLRLTIVFFFLLFLLLLLFRVIYNL